MAKRKGKKPKESFKEILDKGLEAVVDVLKRADVKDIAEVAIYGGLAYAGYQAPLLGVFPDPIKLMWGPVALKLATTPTYGGEFTLGIKGVEVPVNSQIAGLTMLSLLGFASLPWGELPKAMIQDVEDTRGSYQKLADVGIYEVVMLPEEKAHIRQLEWDVASSLLGTRAQLQKANSALLQYLNRMEPEWKKRLEYLEYERIQPR